jgi:hypothetical protein
MLGLLAGALVGLGLSYTMIPYLSQALAGSLAGVPDQQIAVDWPAMSWRTVAPLYLLLVLVYGAALGILLGVLGKLWKDDRRHL